MKKALAPSLSLSLAAAPVLAHHGVAGVGAAVAAFFVMWGAFLYMSAAGSPHQMERGKSAIVNALVGFSIVLMARVIAGMIQDSIGA